MAQEPIVPGRRSAALTGGLARASAGASLRTPLVQVANIARALDQFREAGAWVYAVDQEGEYGLSGPLTYEPPDVPGGGRRSPAASDQAVRKACDAALRIPMYGGVGSLNVAVAGAIVLYHAVSSRRDKDRDAA